MASKLSRYDPFPSSIIKWTPSSGFVIHVYVSVDPDSNLCEIFTDPESCMLAFKKNNIYLFYQPNFTVTI